MDQYDRYRESPDGCGWMVVTSIFLAMLFLLGCFLLPSCTTTRISTKTNTKDSTVVHHLYDTTHVTVQDTNRVEQHVVINDTNTVVIQFGQGGGTYNALTGQATNVTGVQQSTGHREQRDSTAFYKHKYENMRLIAQDLSAQLSESQYEYSKVKEYKRSGWDRFCTWWFIITAIFLLLKIACWVMEKIPATAPWVAIVRKFVPVL